MNGIVAVAVIAATCLSNAAQRVVKAAGKAAGALLVGASLAALPVTAMAQAPTITSVVNDDVGVEGFASDAITVAAGILAILAVGAAAFKVCLALMKWFRIL